MFSRALLVHLAEHEWCRTESGWLLYLVSSWWLKLCLTIYMCRTWLPSSLDITIRKLSRTAAHCYKLRTLSLATTHPSLNIFSASDQLLLFWIPKIIFPSISQGLCSSKGVLTQRLPNFPHRFLQNILLVSLILSPRPSLSRELCVLCRRIRKSSSLERFGNGRAGGEKVRV